MKHFIQALFTETISKNSQIKEWIVLTNHRKEKLKLLLIITLNCNSISQSIVVCRTAYTVVT